jgi:virginiamycin B lyase
MRLAAIALCVFLTACTQTVTEAEETPTSAGESATTSATGVAPPVTTTVDESATSRSASIAPESLTVVAFSVPAGSRPHDVAPALDGGVWYTAQGSGELGWLNPVTPWVTDGGLNAIVNVDPR